MWASTFVVGHIANSTPLFNFFLCAGQPSYDDIQHPDYIPSLRLDGKENDTTTTCQKLERYKRPQQCHILALSNSNASSGRQKDADEQREQLQIVEEDNKELKVQVASLRAELASLTAQVKLLTADVETQRLENSVLQKEVQLLKDHPMSVNFIRDCDKRTKFFTGLTTFFLFTTVFEFVAPQVHRVGKLAPMDEFLMVLMKLRLSLLNEDLSYRFGVSVSAVSRYFTSGWKSCTLDSNPASGGQTKKLFKKLCRPLLRKNTQRYIVL